jgi:hypothetical protein
MAKRPRDPNQLTTCRNPVSAGLTRNEKNWHDRPRELAVVVTNTAISADADWSCLCMATVGENTKVARHADWVYYLFLFVRYLFRVEISNRLRDCGRGGLGAVSLSFSEMEKFKLRHYLNFRTI